MQKFLFIILICSLCFSCGVKDRPEYKSQDNFNKPIQLV